MKTIIIILTIFLAGCYCPPRECKQCETTLQLTKRLHQHRLGWYPLQERGYDWYNTEYDSIINAYRTGKYKSEMSGASQMNTDLINKGKEFQHKK